MTASIEFQVTIDRVRRVKIIFKLRKNSNRIRFVGIQIILLFSVPIEKHEILLV